MKPAMNTGPTLRVIDLVTKVKDLVQSRIGEVSVEGELSNFKRPASGHCYFTLKDAEAQIRCVMWRTRARGLFFQPEDGMLVRVRGEVTVYEVRGDLQMIVYEMMLAGEGALQKAFEERKRRLAAEGLFDAQYKRPLPRYPETVGIVTSGTGAALHDMLSILERRFPLVRVLVCPVQVQGQGAAEMIAEAIEAFNAVPPGDPFRADVLIVGRGGGSAEDLWAFNEEVVARAIFASQIPIISAVGHETDFSIADFVADVRAATPSMAAELAVPDRQEVAAEIRGLHGAMRTSLLQRISAGRQRIERLIHSHAFNRPLDRLQRHSQRLDELIARLHRSLPRLTEERRRHTEALAARLALLDPQRPLRQGYTLVLRDGEAVTAAADLQAGNVVTLRFHDGERTARISK